MTDRTTRADGHWISEDPALLDRDRIFEWLSVRSYWATGRDRETIDRSIEHSMVFGVYRPDGVQVAFARMVTDRATFGYLCDVFVDDAERGRGLGSWVVRVARDRLAALGVYRMVLITHDAHEVYRPLGFDDIRQPERWMVLDTRESGHNR